MTVDDLLDQSNWPPAWTRAHALAAACTWLPVTDGEEALLEAAERFAAWIEADNAERAEWRRRYLTEQEPM